MRDAASRQKSQHLYMLAPERVAYWYFRLNGFLQIENFVVHPKLYGGQRTDADLIGVRFPFRAERLIDDPTDLMQDDSERLQLLADRTDIVIAEVKTGRCALNGPWTSEASQNIQRVLSAIGSLPTSVVGDAANALYSAASFDDPNHTRIRLILVGRESDAEIAKKYAGITQLTWAEILSFIWQRFDRYKRQKAQVDQWDNVGRLLKQISGQKNEDRFIEEVTAMMGVRMDPPKAAP